ncbi:MAG TPA: hypothetical protein DD727_08680, partial [Clostridiales bacterium]|nr:hypothetical protein [Clostridiales bacterium]
MACGGTAGEERMDRPNILIICSDQHHPRAAGFLGSRVISTPSLDSLAAGGAVFSQCYCNYPLCTPSRMSFITGQYAHRIHIPDNGFPLDPGIMTWARKLTESGYRTVMLGKMDFCGDYQDGGFAEHRVIRRRPARKELQYIDGVPCLAIPSPTRRSDAFRSWGSVLRHMEHAGPRTARILPEAAEFGERDDFIGNYDHDQIVTQWAVDFLQGQGLGQEQDSRPEQGSGRSGQTGRRSEQTGRP